MKTHINAIEKYWRAANYLAAVQIYLQDNFLLERKLKFDDIKPRLLGHWGTSPGINFVYTHLNALIKEHDQDMLFVLGPGHGFPALQANLFLEKTLEKFYPEATHTLEGISYIARNFSWPYGFPSHSNPGTPGVILEGGELGYSLSTSYGAALDNPELIVACLVGDGEAETGPTATAWHINKFLNPRTDGAVLPILHLNGYKISGPTIMGRMSDQELKQLFSGYGYEPIIVDVSDNRRPHHHMQTALQHAYTKIRTLQKNARAGKKIVRPRWPMIIFRNPKGWGGISELDNNKIEGNCLSHQVIAPEAKTNEVHLRALDTWLRSYNFQELFDKEHGFYSDVMSIAPDINHAMGMSQHAHGGDPVYKPLELPSAARFAEDAKIPGTIGSSSMRRAGEYINEVARLNKNNFRFFSPDETYSNKLDKIFETTARSFQWPIESWDKDLSPDGRVIEMLSEHTLQGLMQGYVLTGRHAIFASYEAFVQIVNSMADQYAKFLHVARETNWRGKIPSLNYILTSSGWRQDHNGFSHQNPGFIDDMLQRQGCFVNIYFPADGNTTLAVLKRCLESTREINVIVAGKTLEPRWLTPEQAQESLKTCVSTWDFASDPDPDIVFSAAGDYLTKEALVAIDILKNELPAVKIRFVNILELSCFGLGGDECHAPIHFEKYYTEDKPVIFNFHGYPQTLKQILFDYAKDPKRFAINGYTENGSTTTPFDMHVRNNTDRYHLVMQAAYMLQEYNVISIEDRKRVVEKYTKKLETHYQYIKKHGVDPEEIDAWTWPGK